MAYESRSRKRINALRRAPDGSAFQFCKSCGVSIAVALVDMHQCERKKIKILKGETGEYKIEVQLEVEQRFLDQPRSEFRFFMESFMKDCDGKNFFEIDRKGFDTWKNMSSQEKLKYKLQARKVNDAYYQQLIKEEDQTVSCVDEEADSAEVGKFDKAHVPYYDDDSDYSYDSDQIGVAPWW